MRLAGGREWTWLSPPVGFAVVMAICSAGIRLPGHAASARVLLAVAAAASVPVAVRAVGRPRQVLPGVWVGALLLAAGLLPFIANGRVGILGILDNGDLAGHLVLADAMRVGVTPVALDYAEGGYPTGPHALAAVLTALGTDVETSFTALLVSVPILTGLTALSALSHLSVSWRVAAAVIVGMPYLSASYLVQSSFKEPMQGLLVLAFALALRELSLGEPSRARAAAPLGLLAAGILATYSFVGLAWPLATVAAWAVIETVARRGLPPARVVRHVGRLGCVGVGALLLAALPELLRVREFLDDVATVGGGETPGGNILQPVAAFQLLGISPTDDYRLAATSALAPALSAIAVALCAYAYVWWLRRRDFAIPAALLGGLLLYAQARRFATPYYDAKALMIGAPLVTILVTGALADGLPDARALLRRRTRPGSGVIARLGIAGAFVALAALSSSLVLRAALVAPGDHAGELARIRPLVSGAPTLFLGQQDFVFWELRGARLSAAKVYNAISQVPFSLRPDKPLSSAHPLVGGQPLDFDSLDGTNLDRFDYVVTTRTGFTSAPPSNWRAVLRTRSYVLWRRHGRTPDRELLPERFSPAAPLDCGTRAGRRLSSRLGWAATVQPPVLGSPRKWSLPAGSTPGRGSDFAPVPAGKAARQELVLPPGTWDLSLQYVSPRGLEVEAPGVREEMPPSLERGGPYWGVGRLSSHGGATKVSVTVGDASPLSRRSTARLGSLAATRVEGPRPVVPLSAACGRYVDWYVLGAAAPRTGGRGEQPDGQEGPVTALPSARQAT